MKESVCQVRMLADYITAVLASTWSTEGVKDQFNKVRNGARDKN